MDLEPTNALKSLYIINLSDCQSYQSPTDSRDEAIFESGRLRLVVTRRVDAIVLGSEKIIVFGGRLGALQ